MNDIEKWEHWASYPHRIVSNGEVLFTIGSETFIGMDDASHYADEIVDLHNEKDERDQGCEYCLKFKDFIDTMDLEVYIIKNKLIAKHYAGASIDPLAINYCPNCGRELGGDE